jgi:hypothetical protein
VAIPHVLLRHAPTAAPPAVVPGYRRVVAPRAGVEVLELDGADTRRSIEVRGGWTAWVMGVTRNAHPAGDLLAWSMARPSSGGSREPPLDGHFLALVAGPAGIRLWTDHTGTVPVYHGRRADGAEWVGTDPWAVARECGLSALDPVSMQEFLARGGVTSPYTLVDRLRRLAPGSEYWLDPDRHASALVGAPYWVPTAEGAPTDTQEAAHALHGATATFLDAVLAGRRQPRLLFSAGEDSRAIAAMARAAHPEVPLQGIISLDRPNRELALARSAARVLGLPLHTRWRPPDHYVRDIEERLRGVGPGYDLAHAHSWDLLDRGETDLLVNGLGSDMLLKGMYVPSRPPRPARPWDGVRFEGRPGWLEEVARVRPMVVDGVLQGEAVAERRRAHLERVLAFRPESDAGLWSRYWPMSDWLTWSFFAASWAQFPTTSPFLVGSVWDAFRGVAPSDKLNRELFGAAFAGVLGIAGLLPRSGGELPGTTGALGRALGVAIGASFDRFDARQERRGRSAVQGPWTPDIVVRDQAMARLDAVPGDVIERLLGCLEGDDPAGQVLSHPAVPLRVLQLAAVADALLARPSPAGPMTEAGRQGSGTG